MSQPPKRVVIVGGGLAGLACAIRLHEAGAVPIIIEGSDAIGGRVRTDVVDGFLLDRGFQVYLDAYPEAGKLLDLRALDLRPFKPGAMVFLGGKLHRVMDVFREPAHLFASAIAPVGSLADKLRTAIMKWRLVRTTLPEIGSHEDLTTEEYLKRTGFSSKMIDVFFRSFYGGIFLEKELRTSSRMFEFTFKMFSQGSATLPARGMGEIPRQLAKRLPPGTIRCGTKITEVRRDCVTLETGEKLDADAVVIATDATTAANLIPGLKAIGPEWRAVTGIYFAADKSPLNEPIIALNGSGRGLVNNVCALSDTAPGYAPPGKSLISISVLGIPEIPDLEKLVVEELEQWFGPQVRAWRHLRTDRIKRALPERPPFIGPGFREIDGIFICGDHLASASIEGAITSGLRTADQLLRDDL